MPGEYILPLIHNLVVGKEKKILRFGKGKNKKEKKEEKRKEKEKGEEKGEKEKRRKGKKEERRKGFYFDSMSPLLILFKQ